MSRPVSRCTLWAVLIRNTRTHWIYYPSIARTRKEARAAWLSGYSDQVEALKRWRRNIRSRHVQIVGVEVTVLGAVKP